MRVSRFLVLFLTVVACFVPAVGSSAHVNLIESNPNSEENIRSMPEKISLTFAGPLLSISSAVNSMKLHDPSGEEVALSDVQVVGPILQAKPSTANAIPGRYHLTYRVVGEDGHVITGEIYFFLGDLAGKGEGVESLATESSSVSGKEVSVSDEGILVALISLTLVAMGFIYLRAPGSSTR